ncbi:unnamed protein product [Rotaria sp. Silwood2]|nr:unnamed protein product [Rotaria sp. Silwood2]CAF4134737.1 unnamed protein product [Rotaria sp. Silwood2]
MYRMDELKKSIPENIFEHVSEYIVNRSRAILYVKEDTLQRKINSFELGQRRVPRVDRNVVKNLSSRILSNDETDCLAHGLDYGLVPKNTDDMNIVSNIENFFHRITDISQHHKKLMSEVNDKDTVDGADVRVLNSKEMTLASSFRSITDSFRHQVYRFAQLHNRINTEQQKCRNVLKNLKEDKSIVVTRPDKGRGVVLLDKVDYLSKMHTILNDSTKFSFLSYDPTITRETKLIKLLNKLLDEGTISKDFYNLAKPFGSIPGRLYGLPKVHREDIPLRPIVSAIRTFNYGLGKALSQLLSQFIEKKNMIRDSFSFVKELLALPKCMSQYEMVSFDIASLYTNVPLTETIEIILKNLYDGQAKPPAINRGDMKELLDLATENSHFLFNGQLYDQIDGVSMGSPLAPLFAEIFLQDFERKYLSSPEDMGIVYWKRYVDDTFVLFDPTFSVDDVCYTLSQYHPSITFTVEKEKKDADEKKKKKKNERNKEKKDGEEKQDKNEKNTEKKDEEKEKKGEEKEKKEDFIPQVLPFLDVLVRRQPDGGFETRVYRKPTFTSLTTKWDSFVPKTYKYNALSMKVYRAIKICSSYKALHDEFEFIRSLAINNGFPNSLIDSIIRRQLNLIYTPSTPISLPSLTTDTVVLRVPYFGPLSQVYAKRIISATNKNYPLKRIRLIYDVKERVGTGFTLKDPIPDQMQAGVVYEATCPECKVYYIGKTFRHFKTRTHEHLHYQKQDLCLKKTAKSKHTVKRNSSTIKTSVQRKGSITRSQTGKLPPLSVQSIQQEIAKLVKNPEIIQTNIKPPTPKAAIAKHYYTTGHTFTNDDFNIRIKERYKYKLSIKESLLIKQKKPPLNKGIRSVPLYIYADGIEQNNARKQKQRTIPDTSIRTTNQD